MLDFSLNISDLTDGALDCSIYPVPTDEKINELLESTGYEKINLNRNNVTVPEDMQIDLGAVGKGYTGDFIVDILRKNGIESTLLDLGGNIQTVGTKPDGTDWKLGLKSPFGEENFETLEISDCAVMTIIGKERRLCDALSTSVFVMGLEKASELWKQSDDFEMVLVTDNGGISITEGIENNFTFHSASSIYREGTLELEKYPE